MLTRFFAILLLVLGLETATFVHAHDDLIALRRGPDALARESDARVRELAAAALARRRVTRRHLETLASVAEARHLADVEVQALERLRRAYPSDRVVALRLADAYRRAKQHDAAASLYGELLAGAPR